jgi:hypothetical protein
MNSAPELCHHLLVGDAFLPRCRLTLSDGKLPKEINLGFQSLVMVNTHYDQVTFAVCGKVNWLIPIMTDFGNLSGPIAQT